MKTKLFTFFLALAASIGSVFAWDYEHVLIGDFYYNLDTSSQTAEVTYKEEPGNHNYPYSTSVSIPAAVTYNELEYNVTSIGDFAFWTCYEMPSIDIPNSIISIGQKAFGCCYSLTFIEIPTNVKNITYDAFCECTNLISVVWNAKKSTDSGRFGSQVVSFTFGNEVESIPANCCSGMNLLTNITIPNSVTSIGDGAFEGCTGLTAPVYNAHCFAYLPVSYSGAYVIPDGIKQVVGNAFYGCSNLTEITIPNNVTRIGNGAFRGCSKLKSITIPISVTSIGESAFYGCSGLTSIEIPENVATIGMNVVANCVNLTSLKVKNRDIQVVLNADPEGGEEQYIDVFLLSTSLKYISAPACVFDITRWYTSMPSYFPQKLDSIEVTNGELSENALWLITLSRKTLKSIDLSATTHTELIDEAFNEFYNLTSLKLPANLTHVGYKMVAECVKLKSIDIPASVTEIDDRAFEDCRSIETITFGGAEPSPVPGRNNVPKAASQLKRIGNWAFYNAHELQHLEIPEGVTEIGDGAFYGCTYLEDLVLPSSVQSIGDNCFALCAKMGRIVVNSVTPPTIAAKTFFDVNRRIPVYVPDNCVDAYESDPYWSEFDIQGISNMPEGIENVSSSLQGGDRGRLILRDGKVFILRGDKTYTLTGQEVK